MGKGKRSRENKARELELLRQKQEELEKVKRRNKKFGAIFGSICAGVLATVIVVSIILNSALDSGKPLRNTIVAKTEHFEVTGTMASYYLYNTVNTFKTNNSTQLDTFMDVDVSLKKQKSYYNINQTWFDYFVNTVSTNINSYLALAEEAHSKGETLRKEFTDMIEEELQLMNQYASNAGMSINKYLRQNYGRGVKESDVRAALELYYIAYQAYNDYYEGLEVTDEDIDKYVSDNKSSFYTASYYTFTVDAVYDVNASDDLAIKRAVALAKAKAESLAACKTEEAFKAALKAYLIELEEDEKDIDKIISESYKKDKTYSDSSDISKWVFDTARKVGDAKIVEGTESFTIYFVSEPSHLDESETKNFYKIYFTNSNYGSESKATEKAEEVKKTFLAGDITVDAFKALAETYNEDDSVFHENIAAGNLSDDIEKWLFDSARKEFDVEVIKATSGCHLMMFAGNGLPAWKNEADTAHRSDLSTKWNEELIKNCKITKNIEGFDQIRI